MYERTKTQLGMKNLTEQDAINAITIQTTNQELKSQWKKLLISLSENNDYDVFQLDYGLIVV